MNKFKYIYIHKKKKKERKSAKEQKEKKSKEDKSLKKKISRRAKRFYCLVNLSVMKKLFQQ